MKILFVLLFPLPIFAVSFEVIGPCSDKPIYQVNEAVHAQNLGDLTESLLKHSGLPFEGDRTGIKSIDHSPTGDKAIEVLSDIKMRAYGWCVEVDGKQPETMPDQVPLEPSAKKVKWFYAFSLYESGNWTQYCTPSYTIKAKQICP